EIRDVKIPHELEDAMSRQAQAERERQARIILGQAETEIADNFSKAALTYQDNPVALHLRAMNMLYEAIKEKGAMVIVPPSAATVPKCDQPRGANRFLTCALWARLSNADPSGILTSHVGLTICEGRGIPEACDDSNAFEGSQLR